MRTLEPLVAGFDYLSLLPWFRVRQIINLVSSVYVLFRLRVIFVGTLGQWGCRALGQSGHGDSGQSREQSLMECSQGVGNYWLRDRGWSACSWSGATWTDKLVGVCLLDPGDGGIWLATARMSGDV